MRLINYENRNYSRTFNLVCPNLLLSSINLHTGWNKFISFMNHLLSYLYFILISLMQFVLIIHHYWSEWSHYVIRAIQEKYYTGCMNKVTDCRIFIYIQITISNYCRICQMEKVLLFYLYTHTDIFYVC